MKNSSNNKANEIEQLFREYFALLCLVSFAIVKDREVAKDIVQDFFLSFWQNRDRTTPMISFKAYAIRAVKNLSLLSLKEGAKKKLLLENLDVSPYEEQSTQEDFIKHHRLQELLAKIPENRRNIFTSFVVERQSYAEIAEDNCISVNTVKTQMKRAYAFLRTKVSKESLYLLLSAFSAYV